MDDAFLTVAEVAEILKLNQQTVRNWIDRDVLPAVRVGPRRLRVRQSDLDALLEAGSSKPAASVTGLEAREGREDLADALVVATAEGADAINKLCGKRSPDEASAAIDLAIVDFVTELNRALAASGKPYGLEGGEFMRRYDALWTAKLTTTAARPIAGPAAA